jgi:hypothetical protein
MGLGYVEKMLWGSAGKRRIERGKRRIVKVTKSGG